MTGGHAQRRSSARNWIAWRTLGLPFSGGDSDAHLIPASCCKRQHRVTAVAFNSHSS